MTAGAVEVEELPLVVPGVRERDMLDRLRRRYSVDRGNGPRYVYAEQVRSDVGFADRDPSGGRLRCVDALVQCLWSGDGLAVHGFEVKCSREDVRREFADPDKAAAFLPYVDYWWLVLSRADLLRDSDPRPPGWGVMVASGYQGLRVTIPARPNPAPKPMPLGMRAAFLRAVAQTTARTR